MTFSWFQGGKNHNRCYIYSAAIAREILGKEKRVVDGIYFIDLEKAFDRVPREVIWWALRESGVEEWLISVIKSMYDGATTVLSQNWCK